MPGVLWTSVHMTTWVGSGGDSNIFWEAAVYSVWFFKVIMLRSEKREIQALLIETSSSMKIRQFFNSAFYIISHSWSSKLCRKTINEWMNVHLLSWPLLGRQANVIQIP